MELLPYGAGTIPFTTAEGSCEYIERYFPEFPFLPQDFEEGALELWRGREFSRIKTQAWGPVSGEVEDLSAYCGVLEGAARAIEPLAPRRWLVIDEPVFQSIGTPFFPGNPDLAIESVNALINSSSINAKWGLHVCGNTDFTIISRLDIELFHFDAYLAWDALKLYRDDLEAFVGSCGIVSPGAVPVDHEEGEGDRARAIVHDAAELLGDLGQRELPVGPACGMKAVSKERAHEVGHLIRELIE